jgi:hypothetical protein
MADGAAMKKRWCTFLLACLLLLPSFGRAAATITGAVLYNAADNGPANFWINGTLIGAGAGWNGGGNIVLTAPMIAAFNLCGPNVLTGSVTDGAGSTGITWMLRLDWSDGTHTWDWSDPALFDIRITLAGTSAVPVYPSDNPVGCTWQQACFVGAETVPSCMIPGWPMTQATLEESTDCPPYLRGRYSSYADAAVLANGGAYPAPVTFCPWVYYQDCYAAVGQNAYWIYRHKFNMGGPACNPTATPCPMPPTPTPDPCGIQQITLEADSFAGGSWEGSAVGVVTNPTKVFSHDFDEAVMTEGNWGTGTVTDAPGALAPDTIVDVTMHVWWRGVGSSSTEELDVDFSVDGTTNGLMNPNGVTVTPQDYWPGDAAFLLSTPPGGWTWAKVNALRFGIDSLNPGGGPAKDNYIDDVSFVVRYQQYCSPTNTPSLTLTPTRTPTGTVTRSFTSSPTCSPTSSPSPSGTVSPTASPSPSPTATPSPTGTRTPTLTPSASPTLTPSASPTPTATGTPTRTPTPTLTASASPTPTATGTVSSTGTPTLTASASPTPTATGTVSRTGTPTLTPSASPTPTATGTVSSTVTPTLTPSASPTPSSTQTVTSTATPTYSASASPSPSSTITATRTETPTATATSTSADTPTDSPTRTETPTATPTSTSADTPTDSPTRTETPVFSATATPTASPSFSATPSPTDSFTASPSPTDLPTLTASPTPSMVITPTDSPTPGPTATITLTFSQTLTPPPPPPRFHLVTVYPNPIGPGTATDGGAHFVFSLPRPGSVGFWLYDLRGELVWSGEQEYPAGGNYQYSWPATNNSGATISYGAYYLNAKARYKDGNGEQDGKWLTVLR